MSIHGLLRESGCHKLTCKIYEQVQREHVFQPLEGMEGDICSGIMAVATAFKKFMRQMDGRIIGQTDFPLFAVAVHNNCRMSLKLRVHQLDPVAFATLRFVVAFLVKVAAQQATNAMTPSNIGITIAASMMVPTTETKFSYSLAAKVVEQLIVQFDDIFGPDALVLSVATPTSLDHNSAQSSSTMLSDDSSCSMHSAQSDFDYRYETNSSSSSMVALVDYPKDDAWYDPSDAPSDHLDAESLPSHSRQFSYTASVFEVDTRWSLMPDINVSHVVVDHLGDYEWDDEVSGAKHKRQENEEIHSYLLPSLSSRSISRKDLDDFLKISLAA